jgi:hypothetical protein
MHAAITSAHHAAKVLADYERGIVAKGQMRMFDEWRSDLETELHFLTGLQRYLSREGRRMVHDAIHRRLQLRRGALLVGLNRGKLQERLDPLHRAGQDLEGAFRGWLNGQFATGQDPAEHIIDFFLEFDSKQLLPGSKRSMSPDQLHSHAIHFRDGHACAYYLKEPNGEETRYGAWSGDDKVNSNGEFVYSSVHLKRYSSMGKTRNSRQADRGGDFVNGDVYAVSGEGKFYSFHGDTIHSEFFSGDPVLSAGILVAKDGKIQAIDNRSGHYIPTWRNLLQAVKLLQKEGVFDREAVVALVCGHSGEGLMFFSVNDFVALGNADFSFGDTVAVVRGYQRVYGGQIPVPAGKLEYIPGNLRKGWTSLEIRRGAAEKNRWDTFLQTFFLKDKASTGDLGNRKPIEDFAA